LQVSTFVFFTILGKLLNKGRVEFRNVLQTMRIQLLLQSRCVSRFPGFGIIWLEL
jgi:hypothetical protein